MTRDFKKILKFIVLSLFFIFIIVYAFFRSRELIFGVKIKNISLENGKTYMESVQNITGIAKNAVELSLNGREISIDKDGNFSENIALLSGYNIISIEAEDKFGHKDEKDYQLMYSPAQEKTEEIYEE